MFAQVEVISYKFNHKLNGMLITIIIIEHSLLHAKLQGYQNAHARGAACKCRRLTYLKQFAIFVKIRNGTVL